MKTRQIVGPLQRGTGDLVLGDRKTAEVLSSGFNSVFADKCFSLASQLTDDKDEGNLERVFSQGFAVIG